MSKQERQTIAVIFDKLNAPLTSAEVEVEMDQFIQRVNTSGLRDVLDRTNADLASCFNQSKHQRTFLRALHMVAKADGVVGDKERYVVKCLTEALESSLDPPGAPDLSTTDSNGLAAYSK